jgi:hypothetical protein
MTNKNTNREIVIIHPDGTIEISFSSEDMNKAAVCDRLKDTVPDLGKYVLYEWHNAHLEQGVMWQGKSARAWAFISSRDGITMKPNPLASDLRALSLGKDVAPVFGPVLIAVNQ